MKLEFINSQPDNTRLILFFTGWSTGPEIASDVQMPGWDVAVVHDFSDFSLDTSFLDRYYTVYLFAWSLGVFAASRLLPAERITCAFAFNGTLLPVDDAEGIPVDIYRGTANGLDARNLMKFRLRMAGDRATFDAIPFPDTDDIDNLKEQLFVIGEQCEKLHPHDREQSCEDGLPWVRVYLSEDDRIFPHANMLRHWRRHHDVEIVSMKAPHYVPVSEIVRSVVADTRMVSSKFSKASSSYDSHAIAQYSAAIKLAGMLADHAGSVCPEVLEIGCGTGLFTREYARKVKPARITFVDITSTGPFGVADDEEYVVADAERWIEQDTRSWDAIVSASAIQWFADVPRFLHLCSRRLKDGGVLAISTFAPGNLSELDQLRPSPLLYHRRDRLEEWLSRDFDDVTVIEDEIKVEFKSVREILMHLKHTGVAGSASGAPLPLSAMSHLRSLTYRPIYMLARKARNSE